MWWQLPDPNLLEDAWATNNIGKSIAYETDFLIWNFLAMFGLKPSHAIIYRRNFHS